jgi:hypothetical protein
MRLQLCQHRGLVERLPAILTWFGPGGTAGDKQDKQCRVQQLLLFHAATHQKTEFTAEDMQVGYHWR